MFIRSLEEGPAERRSATLDIRPKERASEPIHVDQQLLDRARRAAALRGMSLREFEEQALKTAIAMVDATLTAWAQAHPRAQPSEKVPTAAFQRLYLVEEGYAADGTATVRVAFPSEAEQCRWREQFQPRNLAVTFVHGQPTLVQRIKEEAGRVTTSRYEKILDVQLPADLLREVIAAKEQRDPGADPARWNGISGEYPLTDRARVWATERIKALQWAHRQAS